MLKIIKTSFNILKNNLIFIQPILLYLLFVISILSYLVNKHVHISAQILLAFSLILLTVAVTSGWLFINKKAVLDYNKDDSREENSVKSINNFKKFFEGVGINFFKTLGIYIVISLIYLLTTFFISNLLTHLWGEPKIIYEIPKILKVTSEAELQNIINAITLRDKFIFLIWFFTAYFVTSILNYLSILYFAISSFEEVNIFKSLWLTVKFFLKNIFPSVQIMLSMFVIHISINILTGILGSNSFSYVILILLSIMYLNYYVILVFYFYYDKINSNNRTELIG